MPRGFLFFVKMRTYSNIFIHIPGFTKSDLEFISNSTTHEEVTLLAATCGMFIEKIHFYDPSTIPLHNQYEMKLVDTDVFEIAMFLDEIKAYETVYIGSRRISGNGAHLIHVSIRYNKEEYTSEEFEVDSIERDIILGVIQEVFLTILGKVIDDKNNKKDFSMSSIIFNIPEGYILDKKSSTRTTVVYKKVVSLPSTWESFCLKAEPSTRYILTYEGEIAKGDSECLNPSLDRNVLPSEETAKAVRALIQLLNLREVYKEDDDPAYLCFYNVTIDRKSGDPRVINEAYPSLFSFNRADLAYKFHKNFKDLLKEASPLLF